MNSHIRPLPTLPAFITAALAARPAAALIVPTRAHKLPPLPAPRAAPPPAPRGSPPASAGPRNGKVARQGHSSWENENEHPKHSAKSTASEAQRQRALALLTTGPKTTIELRASGIFQTSTRIKELRGRGHSIWTERIVAVDADGYTHAGVARYHLLVSKQEAA